MSLLIGALSRRAGVPVQTIRFYEREGLLAAPPRSRSGYRVYGEDVIGRLRFIRRAQDLGFTLKEIRDLVALQDTLSGDCAAVRRAAAGKLSDVEERMSDLSRMKAELRKLIGSCRGNGSVRDCAIIECLSHEQ